MPDHRGRRGLTASRFKPTPDRSVACAVTCIAGRRGLTLARSSRHRFVAASRRTHRATATAASRTTDLPVAAIHGRRRRPRGPNALRALQPQHNVGLCKPPSCHGACNTAPHLEPMRGTRRAKPSLRIINVDVVRAAAAARPGPRGSEHRGAAARTSLCAHFVQSPALRVDRFASLRPGHGHALSVLRTHKAACALRAHAGLRPQRSVARGRTCRTFGQVIGRALVWKSRRFAEGA